MTVPAAARVLDMIEVFAKVRRPMTIAGLARALDLPASSCHGLVKTLEDRGYLVKLTDPAGYYFSKRLHQLAQRIGGYDPLPSWVIRELETTRDSAEETTLLARRAGMNAVYVEVLESEQSVRYIAQVGDLRPLYASAAGKALLGSLPAKERAALVGKIRLAKRTPKTIVDGKALLRDLEMATQRGWFQTSGEFLSEVTAVAAPLNLGGDPYAVVIAGPSSRMERNLSRHVKLLRAFVAKARDEEQSLAPLSHEAAS